MLAVTLTDRSTLDIGCRYICTQETTLGLLRHFLGKHSGSGPHSIFGVRAGNAAAAGVRVLLSH